MRPVEDILMACLPRWDISGNVLCVSDSDEVSLTGRRTVTTDSASLYEYFALRRRLRLQCSCDILVDRFDDIIARQRNKDDVTGLREVHDGLGDSDLALAQFMQELLTLLIGSIPDEQRGLLVEVVRAVVGEIAGDKIAHRAEPDPPELDMSWLAWRLRTRVWQILSQVSAQ